MGFKYRKSIKIAPGVRVNIGKKSASVSVGGKGFRKTYSTSGRKTTTVGIPGSGLSYSTSSSTKKTTNASKVQSNAIESTPPKTLGDIYNALSIGCFVVSIPLLLVSLLISLVKPAALILVAISISLLVMGIKGKKLANTTYQEEEAERRARNAELEARRIARNAKLLEWQNAVCEDKSESLLMSEWELEDTTAELVSNDVRIFDDCSNLINKTTNPSVFFPRLALAEEKLVHLCSLEGYIENVSSIDMKRKPSELYSLFLENKEQYVYDFIYKYYCTVKEKAETLKTEKGKQNQFQKFYDSLQPYSDQISEKNKEYAEAMYHRKI